MHRLPGPPHPIFRILANEYPGEIASLVMLEPDEAAQTLGQACKETAGSDTLDQARRVARNLRDLLGLTVWDTEVVTRMSPAESEKFDRIGAAVLQSHTFTPPRACQTPPVEEVVANAIANMAIDGRSLPPAAIENVRTEIQDRFGVNPASVVSSGGERK